MTARSSSAGCCVGRAVRKPGPAVVEADKARERAPGFDLTPKRRELPPQVKVGERVCASCAPVGGLLDER